jgi:hypothetical protein
MLVSFAAHGPVTSRTLPTVFVVREFPDAGSLPFCDRCARRIHGLERNKNIIALLRGKQSVEQPR